MNLEVGKKVMAKAYVINNEPVAVNFDAVIEKVYERSVLLNVEDSKVFPKARKAEFNNRLVVSFSAIQNASAAKIKSADRANKLEWQRKQHQKMVEKMNLLKPQVQKLLDQSVTIDEIRHRLGYNGISKMIQLGIVNRPETYRVKLIEPNGKVTYYKSLERMAYRHAWTASTIAHYADYRGYKIEHGLWNDATGEIKPVKGE